MNKYIAITLIAVVATAMLLSPMFLTQHTYAKTSAAKKAQKDITKKLDRATEGKWDIKILNITRTGSNQVLVVVNKTTPTPPTPPPNPPPNPPPTPNGPTTVICAIGDMSGSSVVNSMKNCNLKVGLGDCGYKNTLADCRSFNLDKCVIGNHEATEDGSASLYTEALALCQDGWWLNVANGTTLLIGLNTNGDVAKQMQTVKTAHAQNPNVKLVVVFSHKGGHVFPNAHHPAEAQTLYQQIESLIVSDVNLIEVAGHNHNLAQGGNWFITGGGGKSHYTCGTDAIWTFCDNTHYGYLKLTISNNNGHIESQFIGTDGKVLH